MPALRPSSPPPAPASAPRARALPLSASRTAAAFRAGDLPRGISPARHEARTVGATALQAAASTSSAGEVAGWFGSVNDRTGAELLSGKAVVSAGELAMLPPVAVASAAMLDLLATRLHAELSRTDLPEEIRVLVGIQLQHVAAARALAKRSA